MVFGFFRKRKAQPAAPQQETELVQAVEEAVQTEEVAAQPASETAEPMPKRRMMQSFQPNRNRLI